MIKATIEFTCSNCGKKEGASLSDHMAIAREVAEIEEKRKLAEKLWMPIEQLEMSYRVHSRLKRYGSLVPGKKDIVYVGDLIQETESHLLRLPEFGRKSLQEVREILAKMDLSLGMKLEGWPDDASKP